MAAIFKRVSGAAGGQGTVREEFYDITFDANYTTGGVPVTPDDAGMVDIVGMRFIGHGLVNGAAKTSTHYIEYDHRRRVIQFFTTGAALSGPLSEAAPALVLSNTVLRACVTGF